MMPQMMEHGMMSQQQPVQAGAAGHSTVMQPIGSGPPNQMTKAGIMSGVPQQMQASSAPAAALQQQVYQYTEE